MAGTVLILLWRPWPVIGRLLTDRVQMCCTQKKKKKKKKKTFKFRPSLFHNNISMVQRKLCTQVIFSGTKDWCTVSTAHLCFFRFSKNSSWRNNGNFSHSWWETFLTWIVPFVYVRSVKLDPLSFFTCGSEPFRDMRHHWNSVSVCGVERRGAQGGTHTPLSLALTEKTETEHVDKQL
jgi:hypothetical protein